MKTVNKTMNKQKTNLFSSMNVKKSLTLELIHAAIQLY